MNIDLSTLEQDALCEVFNIGIGKAAAALNKMVNDEVELNIPNVELVSQKKALEKLKRTVANVTAVAVTQKFDGDFSGNAVLMFPEDQSLDLVSSLLGDSVPAENLSDFEQEALLEIGNIILNACFVTVSNELKFRVDIDIPIFVQGLPHNLLSTNECHGWSLYMQIHFNLPSKNITGHLNFKMDITSALHFAQGLKRFVGVITGVKQTTTMQILYR